MAWQSRYLPSPSRVLVNALFVSGGLATGVIGWSGYPIALALGVAFPALWAFSPSRLTAAAVSMAHFLGASRGLPEGASIFFGSDLLLGLCLWIGASLLFVGVHTIFWTSTFGWRKSAFYVVAALLTSIPPFGIAGWAHPITAAGILFPGWSWMGLVMTGYLLVAMTTRHWIKFGCLSIVLTIASLVAWVPPSAPVGWQGVDTVTEEGSEYTQQLMKTALVRDVAEQGSGVVLLPESSFGIWSETKEHLWTQELLGTGVTVIGGGLELTVTGYDNVMIVVSGQGSETVYRERMPVPVAMWQPWAEGGAHAYFFENPIFELAGTTVAPLICYEQLIVWPVLQSMLHSPDLIVATGNAWWTGDTNISDIQKATVQSWARLFDVPLVMAFND